MQRQRSRCRSDYLRCRAARLTLPELAGSAKIAPIVSSRKRARRHCKSTGKRSMTASPDFGRQRGTRWQAGILGFFKEDIDAYTVTPKKRIADDAEIREIIALADELEVPVVVAGGVYEQKDLAHYLAMGARGSTACHTLCHDQRVRRVGCVQAGVSRCEEEGGYRDRQKPGRNAGARDTQCLSGQGAGGRAVYARMQAVHHHLQA